MSRKIYFDDKYIEFVGPDEQSSQNQTVKIIEPTEVENQLKNIADQFKKQDDHTSFLLKHSDFNWFFQEFRKQFVYIEAAGGFIEKTDDFLAIHRHGRWDLPKGKLEKNEAIEAAAVRECEEECGIKRLKIIRPLSSTFHVYPHKKGIALKQTYWFYMRSDYEKELKPQTEEDIDEVKWFNRRDLENEVLPDTYYTIADVIREGLSLNFMTN